MSPRRRGLLTRWELALGGVLVAAVAAYAVPAAQRALWRTRLAEAPWVLDELLAAQAAHQAKAGRWFEMTALPRDPSRVGVDAVPWPEALPGGFVPPMPAVRCAYWAEVGASPALHAACDVDGDGVRARFLLRPGGSVQALDPADVR